MYSKSILQALLVTFLWSTSWVLIKFGLQASMPALTFAGLRYFSAFLCLIPFVFFNTNHRQQLRGLLPGDWAKFALLGFVFYFLTQGAQFLSLVFLPAATLTLLLNFSPILIALFSGLTNTEPPSVYQWGGIFIMTIGAVIYFFPLETDGLKIEGWLAAFVGVLANAWSSLLGRRINHKTKIPPLIVTTISMGFGGLLLLLSGVFAQGSGALDLFQWLIVGWLAVINTAFAFTLWNRTLKTLTAVESSMINSTMLPQIAILAWVFLGENLTPRQIAGITLVGVGVFIVQRFQSSPRSSA